MTNIKLRALITTCFLTVLIISACSPSQRAPVSNPWEQQSQTTQSQQTGAQTITPNQRSYDDAPPVTIALLLPLSGAQAALGQSMLQGAQMALFEMGYTNFNLIPRDTKGSPAGARSAATSAINDGAQLILGPLFASSVQAVQPIAQSNNVNIIAFSTDWSLADQNTYLMGFMPFTQVERISRYALSQGYKNFALISKQDKYGDAVTAEFSDIINKNGATIVKSIRFNDPDTLAGTIPNLKDHRFNAVFMPVDGVQASAISNALSENALLPSQVKRIGTGLWDDPRLAAQPSMEGAWLAAPSPLARKTFEQKYIDTFGQQPARLATLAYDATALAANLAQTGFQSGTGSAFNARAITNPNGFAGTDGVFRFKQNGLIERNLSVLEIRNGAFVEVAPARTRF